MDDEAHIGLVHAHAEGVGGDDHPQFAGDERTLDLLFQTRFEPGVIMGAGPAHVLEKAGYFLGAGALAGKNNGTTDLRCAAGEAELHLQKAVDQRIFLRRADGNDFVVQVFPLVAAIEDAQAHAQRFLEVGTDVFDDLLLGGCGKATHWRHFFGRLGVAFADEARHIEIIGAKVVAPFGQAVRLVEHPGADPAHADGFDEGAVAELLGRNQQNAGIAEAYLVQHVAPLGHGQHAVQGRRVVDPGLDQVIDLILHQRLQRRDDDAQAAIAPMPRQGGQLVADRLAAAGGQNGEQAFAGITGAGDVFLQRAASRVFRFGAKGSVAEKAFQFLAWIEIDRTIRAVDITTGAFAQLANLPAGGRELQADPWRQHGIAAADTQPGEDVGKRTAGLDIGQSFLENRSQAVWANLAKDEGGNPATDLVSRGRHGLPDVREKTAETAAASPAEKEMMAGKLVGAGLTQGGEGLVLVRPQPERQLGILERVAARIADQFVVLDQAVIRVGREGEGRKLQRVDGRQAVQQQFRVEPGECRQIVADDIVSDDEGRAFGQGVDPG